MYQQQPDEVAIQTSVFTRRGIERIVRFAFELAVKRNKKKRVTSITKSNAQGYSMVLWDRTFQEVAAEYPDVETESLLVDAAAMNFIRRPESFDVVVGSNLFGDILSDISAIIIGSMGLAASANLDPLRRFPSMFEPVHGSAPDIAGKGIVNPLATILSAGMMLDHLQMAEAAREVEARRGRGAGRGQGAHARPGRQEQHGGSDHRRAGETRLVAEAKQRESTGRHAFLVSAGILLSRLVGLVRQRIFSRYFGLSDAADAFNAAFRIPNFLQNLFGEGVLSASFIPVYARLLAEGDEEEAGRVAGAVAAILALTTSVLVLLGVLATPFLIDVIAPGFHGAKRELTIRLVRILFPGRGPAGALRVVPGNSEQPSQVLPLLHRAGAVEPGDDRHPGGFPAAAARSRWSWCWRGVRWPAARCSSACSCRWCCAWRDTFASGWKRGDAQVREVIRNFVPVFVSRGVVQISAYVDVVLASYLPQGAVAGADQRADALHRCR